MTITIIKTNGNRIFGGFTTVSWDQSGSYKAESNSFIFSVDERCKFPIGIYPQNAIYCKSTYGPTFGAGDGNGHNIYISDNSNSNTNSYVINDSAYNVKKVNGSAYVLNAGT